MADSAKGAEVKSDLSLVERIIEEGGMINNPAQESYAKLMLGHTSNEDLKFQKLSFLSLGFLYMANDIILHLGYLPCYKQELILLEKMKIR